MSERQSSPSAETAPEVPEKVTFREAFKKEYDRARKVHSTKDSDTGIKWEFVPVNSGDTPPSYPPTSHKKTTLGKVYDACEVHPTETPQQEPKTSRDRLDDLGKRAPAQVARRKRQEIDKGLGVEENYQQKKAQAWVEAFGTEQARLRKRGGMSETEITQAAIEKANRLDQQREQTRVRQARQAHNRNNNKTSNTEEDTATPSHPIAGPPRRSSSAPTASTAESSPSAASPDDAPAMLETVLSTDFLKDAPFPKDILDKAMAYRKREISNQNRRASVEYKLNQANEVDREERSTEYSIGVNRWKRDLRQIDKDKSYIKAELLDAPENLLRAERTAYRKFTSLAGEGLTYKVDGLTYKSKLKKNEASEAFAKDVSSPEEFVAKCQSVRDKLRADVDKLQTEIHAKQKAYNLNTMVASKDSIIGPKMKELEKQTKKLGELDAIWSLVGGADIDAAREMVKVKEAYDWIATNEQRALEEQATNSPVSPETPTTADTPESPSADTPEDDGTSDLLDARRGDWLKYLANMEKTHRDHYRINPYGKLAYLLSRLGMKNFVAKHTSMTSEEAHLATEYTKFATELEQQALEGLEKDSDEYRQARREFIKRLHAEDRLEIAKIQKEKETAPKRPVMRKILRKLGYVAAGGGAAAVAVLTSPMALIATAPIAAAAVVGIRRQATKHNAHARTKKKYGGGLEADRMAVKYSNLWSSEVDDAYNDTEEDDRTVADIAGAQLDAAKNEVGKNRKRMTLPLGGAAIAGIISYFGGRELLDHFSNTPVDNTPAGPNTDSDPGPGVPEVDPSPTGNHPYPWDWAVEKFGLTDAMSKLHELADRASLDGHEVVWNNVGDGIGTNDWISINGNSDTDYVISILEQYI